MPPAPTYKKGNQVRSKGQGVGVGLGGLPVPGSMLKNMTVSPTHSTELTINSKVKTHPLLFRIALFSSVSPTVSFFKVFIEFVTILHILCGILAFQRGN